MAKKDSRPTQRRLYLLALLLVLGALGCQKRPSCESVEATATAAAIATGTPISLTVEQVEQRWEQGTHSRTYSKDEDNGNSSCARCHAPLEWQPVTDELPDSWLQAGLTGLTAPIEIAESEWSAVSCEVCHPQPREAIDGEIAWLEVPPLATYKQVDSSAQLCGNCHLAEQPEDHTALLFEGVHMELACTDCHDPHDGSATCGTSTCHQPFAIECEVIETHDRPHSVVTCSGCHDGLGLPIGWNEKQEKWDTFIGGDPQIDDDTRPYNSHFLVLEVDCDRCHAPGDHPWDP